VAKGACIAGVQGVNERLMRFLFGCQIPPRANVCVMDYYDSQDGLVELMIAVSSAITEQDF